MQNQSLNSSSVLNLLPSLENRKQYSITRSERFQQLVRQAFLLFVFSVASACVLDLQLREWSLREGSYGFGLTEVLQGNASKPWAFRILVPHVVNAVHDNLPSAAKQLLSNERISSKIRARYWQGDRRDIAYTAEIQQKYLLMSLVMFAAYLGTLYVLKFITVRTLDRRSAFANLAPFGFALMLPMTFVQGSYFYDPVELFFIASFLAAVLVRRYAIAAFSVFLGVLNKESNLLLPILYFPILLAAQGRASAFGKFAGLQVVALFGYLIVRWVAADSPAQIVEYHLPGNIAFWGDWRSYFRFFGIYNSIIPFPQGANIIMLILMGSIVSLYRRWDWISQCLLLTTVVSVPLLVLFCFRDEIRNLSFMFVPMYLVIVQVLDKLWDVQSGSMGARLTNRL